MSADVKITDNSGEFQTAMKEQIQKALERCGLQAENFAKDLCPVDTGNLRNSITHAVNENSCEVGSAVNYAAYVELGTGQHASTGGGRSDAWAFQDAQGEWHMTTGNVPQPFLKPAVAEHADLYRQIVQDTLKD